MSLSTFDSLSKQIQTITDTIKRDVETQLERTFRIFDVEQTPILNDPEHTSCFMKIKSNDNGHVRVKTLQKEPHSDWKVHVEEYDRRRSPRAALEEEGQSYGGKNLPGLKQEDRSLSRMSQDKDKMLMENEDRLAIPPSFERLSQRMQRIADSFKRDVERQLDRTFRMFDVIEHSPILNDPDPENTSYYMKIKTDDNDHVKVKTTQKEPNSDWKVHVEEYDKGKRTSLSNEDIGNTKNTLQGPQQHALKQQQQQQDHKNSPLTIQDPQSTKNNALSTFTSPFEAFSHRIQRMTDSLQQDVERRLESSFKAFDSLMEMEHPPILKDPEHTSYFMRVKTDDNGHVRVKTMQKEPDSDWKVHVEEYDRKDRALGQKDENRAIRQEEKSKTITNQDQNANKTINNDKNMASGMTSI